MDIRHSVLGTPHRKVLANHRHEETEAPQGLKGSGERSPTLDRVIKHGLFKEAVSELMPE